jgi:hypothetical protein
VPLNEHDLLAASREHVESARLLFGEQKYALANYVAGLSVELVLRAYRWRIDQTLDKRHDLREWLTSSQFDRVVPDKQRELFGRNFAAVAQQWSNLHRSYSEEAFRRDLKERQLDRKIKGDFVKERVRIIVDAAYEIVSLGSVRWMS